MKLRAYDLHDQHNEAMLVIAGSEVDALILARRHIQALRGDVAYEATVMERLLPTHEPAKSAMQVAIERGEPGICHLLSDSGWLVLRPGEEVALAYSPEPMRMFHYEDDDGYDVVLFTKTRRRAEELYRSIVADYTRLPTGWVGCEWETWSLFGRGTHIAQAEARGIEGIGIYSLNGWQILPLDYARLGVDPPS